MIYALSILLISIIWACQDNTLDVRQELNPFFNKEGQMLYSAWQDKNGVYFRDEKRTKLWYLPKNQLSSKQTNSLAFCENRIQSLGQLETNTSFMGLKLLRKAWDDLNPPPPLTWSEEEDALKFWVWYLQHLTDLPCAHKSTNQTLLDSLPNCVFGQQLNCVLQRAILVCCEDSAWQYIHAIDFSHRTYPLGYLSQRFRQGREISELPQLDRHSSTDSLSLSWLEIHQIYWFKIKK